jgi:toxin ParE1/3/4
MRWSSREFGKDAALRYDALLTQVFADIAADPDRLGAQQRPELASGVMVYHLCFSRDRARGPLGAVRHPRHFVIYRRQDHVIEILRVLHDARELRRHLPEQYRADPAATK